MEDHWGLELVPVKNHIQIQVQVHHLVHHLAPVIVINPVWNQVKMK